MGKNRVMEYKNLLVKKRTAKIVKEKRYDEMCQEYHYPVLTALRSNYKVNTRTMPKPKYEQKKQVLTPYTRTKNEDDIVFIFN